MQYAIKSDKRGSGIRSLLVSGCVLFNCCSCVELVGTVSPTSDFSAARRLTAPEFSPANVRRIAVVVRDETDRFLPSGILRRVDDEGSSVLIQKGYSIAARADRDAIAGETQLLPGDKASPIGPQVGSAGNATAVLVVSITSCSARPVQVEYRRPKDKTVYHRTEYLLIGAISARLVDVGGGEVLWLADHSGSTRVPQPDQSAFLLPELAAEVARALPARPSPAMTTQPGP